MEIMIVTILAALAFSPLLVAYRRHQKGKNPKGAMALNIVSVFADHRYGHRRTCTGCW